MQICLSKSVLMTVLASDFDLLEDSIISVKAFTYNAL